MASCRGSRQRSSSSRSQTAQVREDVGAVPRRARCQRVSDTLGDLWCPRPTSPCPLPALRASMSLAARAPIDQVAHRSGSERVVEVLVVPSCRLSTRHRQVGMARAI